MARIYIGNLSLSVTANDVRHAFVPYDRVLNVSIVTDSRSSLTRMYSSNAAYPLGSSTTFLK